MEQLQNIYDNIKDNNEFVIMEKYGNNAKHYTIVLISKKIFLLVPITFHISSLLMTHTHSHITEAFI